MWNAQPVIFEDEDEEKLKADFIRLCALYPTQDIFEIASYVFKHQRDPEMRSQQAGMIWSKDIEVQERIRLAKLNGGEEPSPIDDIETQLRKLQAIYDNEDIKVPERVAAMRLHAEISGRIIKAIDKKVDHTKRPPRQIVFAQYADN